MDGHPHIAELGKVSGSMSCLSIHSCELAPVATQEIDARVEVWLQGMEASILGTSSRPAEQGWQTFLFGCMTRRPNWGCGLPFMAGLPTTFMLSAVAEPGMNAGSCDLCCYCCHNSCHQDGASVSNV